MSDTMLWYSARVAALAAFLVLSAALLSGIALRTALLAPLARNRAVLAAHGFLSWFWVPLIGVHIGALLLDASARIRPVDVALPFDAAYARLGIGLGTVGLLLLLLVLVTSLLRRHLGRRMWLWIHRLSYPMVALFLVHAQLTGSDFARPVISIVGWATMGGLVMLSLPRLAGARFEVGTH